MPNPLSMFPGSIDTPRGNRLVAIARYDKGTQLDPALLAWSRVAPEFQDWRFELHGEHPARGDLESLITRLAITDSASLMGPTDDVERVLLGSRLSTLPSLFEGLPTVLAESLACGEIATDGVDGRLVHLNHVSGLTDAFRELMGDAVLTARMAAAGRRSPARYAPDTVMDLWEDLITRTLR